MSGVSADGLGDDFFEVDPDEARQRLLKASRPGDDLPTGITVRQAAMMANLVGAAVNGHDMREALSDVEAFLTLMMATSTSTSTSTGSVLVRGTSDPAKLWADVERWPIPPPGPPRTQPA